MGKGASFSILAVMLLTATSRLEASPATPAMIAEVVAALDKGDAQHAQTQADAVLRDEGVSAGERGTVLLYRGLARELLGAQDDAMHDFTVALDSHGLPPDAREQALLQRGFLRDSLGRLDEALRDYSAVIAMKGDSLATALNNRANILRRLDKLREARRDYLAALSAGGGKPQYSWFGLGQIAEAGHDMAAARGFYARSVSADPDYAAASQRLAALGGAPDGAIAEREEKIVLRPPPPQHAEAQIGPGDKIVTNAPPQMTQTVAVTLHPRRSPHPAVPGLVPVSAVALRPALDQPSRRRSPVGGIEIQLGAWRSAAEADAGWSKASAQAADVLGSLHPRVLAVDFPRKGRYFRLRVVPGSDQSASEMCSRLTARGIDCLPVRD